METRQRNTCCQKYTHTKSNFAHTLLYNATYTIHPSNHPIYPQIKPFFHSHSILCSSILLSP